MKERERDETEKHFQESAEHFSLRRPFQDINIEYKFS